MHLNERGELHDLTEEEVRLMSRNLPELEALLANPEAIPQEVVDRSNVEQWEKAAGKLLTQCCKLKGSFWFQEAVDPVKFNILDYFDIISTPMDLGTLRKKLSHNCYSCLKEFTDELSLIWENCFKYNGQEH